MTDLVHVPRAVRVTGSIRPPDRLPGPCPGHKRPRCVECHWPDEFVYRSRPEAMRVDIYLPPRSKTRSPLVGQGACYIDGVKRRSSIEYTTRPPNYAEFTRLQPESMDPVVEFKIDGEYVTWDVDLYVNNTITLRWRPRDTPLMTVLGTSKHP